MLTVEMTSYIAPFGVSWTVDKLASSGAQSLGLLLQRPKSISTEELKEGMDSNSR